MFPVLAVKSSERVMRHAAALFDTIKDDPSLLATRKRELLAKALERTITSMNQPPNV